MADITFSQKVVDLVQCTGEMAARLEKTASEKEAQDRAITDRIPAVVDALIKNDRITADLRKEAETALRDPVRALEILANTANHRTPDELNHLGGSETEKKAGHASWCGPRTDVKRESDRSWELAFLGRECSN